MTTAGPIKVKLGDRVKASKTYLDICWSERRRHAGLIGVVVGLPRDPNPTHLGYFWVRVRWPDSYREENFHPGNLEKVT